MVVASRVAAVMKMLVSAKSCPGQILNSTLFSNDDTLNTDRQNVCIPAPESETHSQSAWQRRILFVSLGHELLGKVVQGRIFAQRTARSKVMEL